jgi:uncharacterized membrane protein
MTPEVQELLRNAVTNALGGSGEKFHGVGDSGGSNGALSGMKGITAGAAAAALAPVAFKGAAKLAKGLAPDIKSPGEVLGGATSKLGDRVTSSVNEKIKDQIDGAGGPGGVLKNAAMSMLPFGGDRGGGAKGGIPGAGKGRRMPVQQSVDIGLPIEIVYNQWTQFEEWPNFMHRVTRVTQEDDCTVSFATKIWGKKKEFTAKIETQRPNERIKWRVTEGMDHIGVVSFHELGPNLTRVLLGFDVQPGGMIEKAARGMRYVKRAARGDLHRFKAFVETAEQETGAWRGIIEDGEVVEGHDPSYDKQREYSDIEALREQRGSDEQREEEVGKSSEPRRRGRKSGGSGQSRGRGQSQPRASSASNRSRASRTSSSGGSGSGRRGRSQTGRR